MTWNTLWWTRSWSISMTSTKNGVCVCVCVCMCVCVYVCVCMYVCTAHKPGKYRWYYLVKWVGYSRNRASWEPGENILSAGLLEGWAKPDDPPPVQQGPYGAPKGVTPRLAESKSYSATDPLPPYCIPLMKTIKEMSNGEPDDFYEELMDLVGYLRYCARYQAMYGRVPISPRTD